MTVRCQVCNKEFAREVQEGRGRWHCDFDLKLASQGQYERLILSAGDGDFEDAIDYVKSELHKEIWIAGFNESVSADLQ